VSQSAGQVSPGTFAPACLVWLSSMEDILTSWRNRYAISKLIEVLFIRELVSRLKPSESAPPVIIDLVNPGLCYSNSGRDMPLSQRVVFGILRALLARSTETGSRTLVHGAAAGPTSHGEFMSDGQIQLVEKWIYEDVGKRAQKKVFEQTLMVLETRSPGVGKALELYTIRS
jgi:hypothetical protein